MNIFSERFLGDTPSKLEFKHYFVVSPTNVSFFKGCGIAKDYSILLSKYYISVDYKFCQVFYYDDADKTIKTFSFTNKAKATVFADGLFLSLTLLFHFANPRSTSLPV